MSDLTAAGDPYSDIHVAQLLCTRLCHDLSGPIGAMSAGAELMADGDDPTFQGEALALLTHSSEAASARLRFLRAAFGVAGMANSGASLQGLIEGYADATSGQAVRIIWQQQPSVRFGADAGQLLLNLCLIAIEVLGGDGQVDIALSMLDDSVHLSVITQGKNVRMPDSLRECLDGQSSDVTVRTVQYVLTGRLADRHGGIHVDVDTDRVRFTATVSVEMV